MIQQARDKVKKHIKTHSEHSVEDRAAISLLGTFLNPGGRINTSFAANDTWPNHDGTFEFISNPDVSIITVDIQAVNAPVNFKYNVNCRHS